MKRFGKYILQSFLFLPVFLVLTHSNVIGNAPSGNTNTLTWLSPKDTIVDDTTKLKYPFRDYKDPYSKKNQNSPLYLKNPSNVQTEVEYNPETGEYEIKEKVGDINIRPSARMSTSEYSNFTKSNSISNYWMEQRRSNSQHGNANESFLSKYLNPKLNVNIKGFDKIFGSNVIDIKPQGAAELIFGININRIENPTLPINLQRSTTFDFDMKIQMGVTGKIGEKMKVGINYNTEAQFDFENQTTLTYTGDEDEIIQSIEAGNVSLPLTGTLINGSQSLFGIKTALQFGKLRVTSIFSQQKAESSTITVEGGATTSDYEIRADEYEANKHFFLSHYFKDNYDRALQNLPVIASNITITKIEVWVTNKTGNFENSRNILGLMDLGETWKDTYNKGFVTSGTGNYPGNDANTLYSQITSMSVRDINEITGNLNQPNFESIIDFAKIENAKLLSPNEYTVHPQLGYISLNSTIDDDEVLAVAYEYSVAGQTYRVGEFSNGGIDAPQTLFLKMIKGPAMQPNLPTWDLMMKNVYAIGSYRINSEDFKLDILYNDDKTGTTVNYIDLEGIKGKPLLKVMRLDQVNSQLDPQPDGYFDFMERTTINSSNGRIYFPVREPFGSFIAGQIKDDAAEGNYVFTELYDSTQSKAKQLAEKSKFIIRGSYKSSGGSEIPLNAFNIPEGSVKVSANGGELVEGQDYIVDYNLGRVTILNQGLLESGTPIKISLENNSLFQLNRKTLLGTHLDYVISDNFSLGATLLHLSEKPLTKKVTIGSEPLSNTIWGLDGRYSTEVPFLTRMVDALPFIDTKESSSIEVSAEFAHLIPGHSKVIGEDGNAYIDDFEGTKTTFDLKAQHAWALASTPKDPDLFNDQNTNTDPLANGYNRALFNWYIVHPDLIRKDSGAKPAGVDKDAQSDHRVRTVGEREIFPNRESPTNIENHINVTNMVFYPNLRGPYNFETERLQADGTFRDPQESWGGIMRELQTNDFEASNIEYIEFWMMDPFIYNRNHQGGDLYFNLGYISEDILKDGRKSFENGLPSADIGELTDETAWGRVPKQQSLVDAFDNDPNMRKYQDIGFDGLNDADEQTFFSDYITDIQNIQLSSEAYNQILADPAGDNFHFFKGGEYETMSPSPSILERYKKYNGPDGNSPIASGDGSYSSSATLQPDVEDINKDNTLNEEETYFQYRVRISPESFKTIGENFLTDSIRAENIKLANGNTDDVTWYQFKIPISEYEKPVGPISDFRSIRFLRMFMHGFRDTTVMRFATLDLVRSEWRDYEGGMPQGSETNGLPQTVAEGFDISTVSYEENGKRRPVNYVLPPGISRVTDPTNPYNIQINEQAIEFKIKDLNDGDSRTAYKNISLDMRQYKKLKMEVHAEEIIEGNQVDGDITAFIRIGSDFKENYYEVEIPLDYTPHLTETDGYFNNDVDADRRAVWPDQNRFEIVLEWLQLAKQQRNNEMRNPGSDISVNTIFPFYPPEAENQGMKISVVGNPNLSNVETVMLGVRNPTNDGQTKSAIVWFNELRLSDFREQGGWAANATVKTKLADLGSVTVSGNTSTRGFGSLDSKIEDRQREDVMQYDIASNFELGKFFPAKKRIRIPVYFGYSENRKTPEYNPLDPDILLRTTLNDPELTRDEKDSIRRITVDYTQRKSFNITNLKMEGDAEKLKGKKKRFYHISNFSASYSFNELFSRNIKTEYNVQKNYAGSIAYVYNNRPKAIEPFKKVKFLRKKPFQLIRDFNFYTAPTMLSFRTEMVRKYQQSLVRDITLDNSIIEPTVRKDFIWNRNYDLKYTISKGLKFEFSALNKARIDEAEGIMNKHDMDDYQHKKDTIWENIKNFGRNTNYNHVINVSYNVPLNKIPLLRWTSATARYKATYDWTASPQLDTIKLGNTITNSNNISLNGTLNFNKLYSQVPYLKKINNKMRKGSKANKKFEDVKYNKEGVKLKKGVAKTITHNLLSEDVKIKVTDESGKEVEGELIVVNSKKVKFRPKEAHENTNIEVTGKKEVKESILKKITEGLVYAAIGVKNVSIMYSETNGTILPGYTPSTRYLGMDEKWNSPGWKFISGWQNDNGAYEAFNKGWITDDTLQTAPYQMTHTMKISAKATLQPLKGLKIDLSASKTNSKNRNEYIFDNVNEKLYTGNFSMSFMMLNTAFLKYGKAYSSKAFDDFRNNREEIAWRLANERNAARVAGSPAYDPYTDSDGNPITNGFPSGYDSTSQEVMIPAFLAAYSGKSLDKVELSPFPKFPLPNWRITYDGLSEIDIVKKVAKKISLTHSYNSTYNVGSYQTNAFYDWEQVAVDGYSWTTDDVDGLFIPEHEINSITLTEAFKPLIGADITWANNLSTKLDYNMGRTMTLSFANNQLIDLINSEIIIGAGYRFDNLPIIIKTGKGSQKFQSDLNLRGDFSIMDMLTVIRKIDENVQPQATAGQKAMSLKLSADYALNERFNLKLFYDHAINAPKISTSFKTTNIKFGISVRFTLIP